MVVTAASAVTSLILCPPASATTSRGCPGAALPLKSCRPAGLLKVAAPAVPSVEPGLRGGGAPAKRSSWQGAGEDEGVAAGEVLGEGEAPVLGEGLALALGGPATPSPHDSSLRT